MDSGVTGLAQVNLRVMTIVVVVLACVPFAILFNKMGNLASRLDEDAGETDHFIKKGEV